MSDLETRFHETWIGMVQPIEGLVVSVPVLVEAQCMHRHPPSFQQFLLDACPPVDVPDPAAAKDAPVGPRHIRELREFLESVLAWTPDLYDAGEALPEDLSLYVPEGKQTLRPTLALRRHPVPAATRDGAAETPAAKAGAAYLALVWDVPDDLNLDKPETRTGQWEYPASAKFDRLLRQCRVPIGLLCNRREVRLFYAPHGESSGVIRFRIDDMASVGGRPILDAFVMLLGAYRFFGARTERQLPAILAESRKRQVNVTNQLADQVFEALQILLRGFEAAAERDPRYAALLRDALEREDDHVYGGLLTVLLRLVFVLYAEDRGLLPAEHRFYAENFSLLSLFDDLQHDHGAFPDSMSRRFGAWPRLLALFRAVFLGCEHGDLRMPPRRGELFDPHVYPFLEGWGPEGSAPISLAENRAGVAVPQVDDETIFRVLQKLILLEGQRLSYRALDVEQIGSVYEALMGYHVRRVDAPAVCLRPDRAKAVWLSAPEVLARAKAQRAKWLKEDVGLPKNVADKLAKALDAAGSEAAALAVLEEHRVRRTETAPAGSLVIQPGSERRRTSSHYTPRSLSAPIVEKTLAPLIAVMGGEPSSSRLLNLKICDPAMGSGAFLVEACRYLADQLVAAWTREKRLDKVADEHDDVVNHARRLVAQRCLYGVDKNRFAVNLAKLSLWLVTLAKDEPFTFVDHALRHGDSLVGLDFEQLKSFHWKPGKQLELCRKALEGALDEAIALRQQILELAASSDVGATQQKYCLLRDAEDALEPVRLIGDLVVGAFFSAAKDKDRQKERDRRLDLVEAWLREGGKPPDELPVLQQEIRARLQVFHWMTEFPEVFYAERPDPLDEDQVNRAAFMDAFVGNPPFMHGLQTARALGSEYVAWITAVLPKADGRADLSAHFLRACAVLLGAHGAVGLITTNTIAQGDSRESGLAPLLAGGFVLYHATSSLPWPGEASVAVATIHLAAGRAVGACDPRILDGEVVRRINSRLRAGPERVGAEKLASNAGLAAQGWHIYGNGFVLTPECRKELLEANPRCAEVLFPYIGGEEVNSDPRQQHERFVINFGERPLDTLGRWPEALGIVRERVKPYRDGLKPTALSSRLQERWWQFYSQRSDLHTAIRPLSRCLVTSRVSKFLLFSFQPTNRVFAESLYVFPLADWTQFVVLQSRVHEPWARLLSSSMRTDLRYAASDCFDTFPFPQPDPRTVIPILEKVGEQLYETRAKYMIDTNQGLTDTYNKLKDPDCVEPRIEELRGLHVEMDRAVLEAYGWGNIEVPPYRTPTTPEGEKALEAFQDEVIDRLFVLNAERAEEEELAGLGAKRAKGRGRTRAGSKCRKAAHDGQVGLLDEEK